MNHTFDPIEDVHKTPRQLADERERKALLSKDFSDPLAHLPQADAQRTAPVRGYSPHYSLGEAIAQEQALEAPLTELQKRGNGGYYEGCLKKAKQAQHPDRAARIATGIANQIERERLEAERIANASNQ
jgi:hypothetical protein